MKILVIGSGGREHAIVRALERSPRVEALYAAPGNAGMGTGVRRIPIKPDALDDLASWARREGIDLTVVGPEQPLAAGIVNRFRAEGLSIFGPSREAARLESSKSFAKAFMERHGIPTPRACVCSGLDEALGALDGLDWPLVIKADGLAAGKGVVIAADRGEAEKALQEMFVERRLGAAAERVVLETFLEGEEASFIAVCDGRRWVSLPTSQDHKRVFDGDAGPNTGGMGAVSPAPVLDDAVCRVVAERVIDPLLAGMAEEGTPFVGFLYAGLMVAAGEPQVLEFNTRLGDPETQAILPRLESDLADLLRAAAAGDLGDRSHLKVKPDTSACVVIASKGYPGPYETGMPISGIEDAGRREGVEIYHAGTEHLGGRWVTRGGRVLGVTALGESLRTALDRAYRSVALIFFEGMHYRSDIGARALGHEGGSRSRGGKERG